MKKQTKLLMAFLTIIICAGICSCEKDDDSEYGSNSQSSSSLKGHKYVDLGLSVKWATCNIGAKTPEDYGDYFAWGEVEPKADYHWRTYKWCNGTANTETKYCTNSSNGTVDNKTTLDPEDDVTHVKWDGDWRMPTKAELDELSTKCSWKWTSQGGVNGYVVTGPNGNSIFLPAAGYRGHGGRLYYAGSDGGYWSSSLCESDSPYAYVFYFTSSDVEWCGYDRCYGFSVRAVCP